MCFLIIEYLLYFFNTFFGKKYLVFLIFKNLILKIRFLKKIEYFKNGAILVIL